MTIFKGHFFNIDDKFKSKGSSPDCLMVLRKQSQTINPPNSKFPIKKQKKEYLNSDQRISHNLLRYFFKSERRIMSGLSNGSKLTIRNQKFSKNFKNADQESLCIESLYFMDLFSKLMRIEL